ncbi:MAG: excinuclease ABC subunit UvrC [Planctomycetes bacterium]|nr:excinuclease ABC subunit UvrC [Planctomycetota bacterium]MBI3834501.1 excinuclease ABC subunit UvrC [Planctomycetota bacterium]
MDESTLDRIRKLAASFPKTPGVYLMKDAEGRVLYVGKAKELRSRVSSYFQASADLLNTRGPDIARMVEKVDNIEFLECESEVDAILKEARLIKDIQPPHNIDLRDDKTFPYLEITTGDDFPGVYVTRTPRLKGSKLYGPFSSPAAIRDAVNALQKVFKFRTCELEIIEGDDSRRFFRPCLLHAINQCTAPCAALIGKEDYARDIDRLKKLLASKRSVLIRQMQKEMEAAAKELRFEEAARVRDRLKAIQGLELSGDVNEDMQPEVFFIDPRKGLERLAELLNLESPPRCMECIDIAHLQGEATVGSLVCFIDGKPFKPGYRRFRINTVVGVDDYAAIREVISRRYRYAAEGEELYPDVILIDGGLGQLHAGMEIFQEMNVRPAMVISLAKREEELYIQARSAPIRLSRNSEALRILQQMRDEAHRFAQAYHHKVREMNTFDANRGSKRRITPTPGSNANRQSRGLNNNHPESAGDD